MYFFLSFLIIIYVINSTLCILPNYNTYIGEINTTFRANVSLSNISIVFFDYPEFIQDRFVLRIRISATFNHSKSILIIIKDDYTIVNTVELWRHKNVSFVSAEKTICPISTFPKGAQSIKHVLSVEISSQYQYNTEVLILVKKVEDFLLKVGENRSLSITKNSPSFFLFRFDKIDQKIAIEIKSDPDTCMILSIQNAACPVHDNSMNVKYSGSYQTITKDGTMIVQNRKNYSYRNHSFFIVFVLNNNDEVCQVPNAIIKFSSSTFSSRNKTFTFSIKEVSGDYYFPIFGAIGFYLLFYLCAPLISILYNYCCVKTQLEEDSDEKPLNRNLMDPSNYGTVAERADMQTLYSNVNTNPYHYSGGDGEVSSSGSFNRTGDTNEITDDDTVSEISTEGNIYRSNRTLYVSDLNKKYSAILDRKYFLYLWYLIIISVFYTLPVVQLVITYQQTVDSTGNQDLCFYNFRCTRPFYIFTAFNNMVSNIGYVLLGLLFTLITWRRHSLYNECKLSLNKKNYNLGIPQYYGLFYAMGISLMMEGFMSACYHICPSSDNFQFDTAYMYILASLCMIKIYQTRHPDINAAAHAFFMTMAFFIFIGVIGVVYNKLAFWCAFTIFYLLLSAFLTCEVYYMGNWRIDVGLPIRVYLILLNEKWRVFVPVHRNRMIVLIIANIINVAFALYGAIERPTNFASHFLAIFMINLLLYFLIYILMKVIYREPFYPLSIVYISIAIVCWAAAIYCFINYPTDWKETPAKSREHNKDCILFDFYDVHDVWHFLSSLSMFFSFMALQNIDDSLFNTEREKIPVF